MNRLDKEIMKAIKKNPEQSIYELEANLKTSNYATVWRHVKKMQENNLLNITEGSTKNGKPDRRETERLMLTPLVQFFLIQEEVTAEAWKKIEKQFLKTRDFAHAFTMINKVMSLFLVLTMRMLLAKEDMRDSETIELLLDTFFWDSYKTLTRLLIESYLKTIEPIKKIT